MARASHTATSMDSYMEESARRESTERVSSRERTEDPADSIVTIRSRLEAITPHSTSITSDQLFALFITLAGAVHLSTILHDEFMYEQLSSKDVGIVDAATKFIGEGRSFAVRAVILPPPDCSFVLKSVLPVQDFNDREEQARIGDVILELRALSHRPLRDHPNIVKLLGLGWETDSVDILRKWPVLIQECAHGTLENLLRREDALLYPHRLELSLGISDGLQAIQRCGIVHGDLKPGNVLIFPIPQQEKSQFPWVAKLADFGGSVLDVAEGSKGRLPMRTRPWQAPEWEEYLTRDGLLRTDVYSLGLTIWSIMAKGALPGLAFSNSIPKAKIVGSFRGSENDTADANEDSALSAFVEAGKTMFAADVNQRYIADVLACSLRLNPLKRNLEMVCQLLLNGTPGNGNAVEPREPDPAYTAVTQLSHVENILMSPDMLDFHSSSVQEYMRQRLVGTVKAANATVKSAAAFTLAVDALRHTENPTYKRECMGWLITSAQTGNQTAQSLVYRFAQTFDYILPDDVQASLERWIIEAAQRHYPAAQQDLLAIVSAQTYQNVCEKMRTRYAGMGWNRFADLYSTLNCTLPEWDNRLRNRILQAMANPEFDTSMLMVNDDGDTMLHFAASAGFEEVTKLWASSMPISVNTEGAQSETPLLIACRSGHGHIVRLLLSMGANPTICSSNGDTPLHWLCSFHGAETHDIANALIAAGADINAPAPSIRYEFAPVCNYEAGTPLHRAVGKGNIDAVRALLAFEASVTSDGGRDEGTPPISLAATLHYSEILELLLESLQDPRAAAHPFAGLSLFAVAIRGELIYGERFSKIARHGQAWWQEARRTFDVIRRWGGEEHIHRFPPGMDCAGTTPLLLACAFNLPETVQYLLENGCKQDINIRSPYWLDDGHYTPLVKSVFQGFKSIFTILLEHGADATQTHIDENWHDLPPLYICAAAGHSDAYFAEALLARGALVDGFENTEKQFETPFACALRGRCFTLAKWLLENGANAHIEYKKGLMVEMTYASSVLGFLLKEKSRAALSCIDWLLREVPDVRFIVSSDQKFSVLHALALNQHSSTGAENNPAAPLVLRTIFDHFKPTVDQTNQQDANGRTAIWLAAAMGYRDLIEQLLKVGADPRITNDDGADARDVNAIMLKSIEDHPNDSFAESDPRPPAEQMEQKVVQRKAIDRLLESSDS